MLESPSRPAAVAGEARRRRLPSRVPEARRGPEWIAPEFQRRNHDTNDDTTGKHVRQQSGQSSAKSRGGRPPKFREPRRPVTVTLPERTLTLLDAVHRDRARAIVRVTDALAADTPESWLVDVVEVLPGLGIILVGPSRLLPKISWLRLIELTPTRYLLSIPSGTPVESLEVALHDLLEVSTPDDVRERTILERLGGLVRMLRRHGGISKAEMLFVDTTRVRADWKSSAAQEVVGGVGTTRAPGRAEPETSGRRPRRRRPTRERGRRQT